MEGNPGIGTAKWGIWTELTGVSGTYLELFCEFEIISKFKVVKTTSGGQNAGPPETRVRRSK